MILCTTRIGAKKISIMYFSSPVWSITAFESRVILLI